MTLHSGHGGSHRPMALGLPKLAALLGVIALGGSITGNEASDSMKPDRQEELADLERAHDIGVISDIEYEANRRRLLDGE